MQTEQTDELEVQEKKPNVTAQKAVQKLVDLDRAVVHVSKVTPHCLIIDFSHLPLLLPVK